MTLLLLVYSLIGALAGVLAGLLGIGGGVVIIPALAFIFSMQANIPYALLMHFAVATSLAAIMITTLLSLWAQYHKGHIAWAIILKMLPGIGLGTALGVLLSNYLNTQTLKILFGSFMLFVAFQMFFQVIKSNRESLPGKVSQWFSSGFIGIFSGLLGIGGGALTIPYLTYFSVSLRNAMSVSTACGIAISFIGTLSYMWIGFGKTEDLAWSTGYVYWPAALIIMLVSPVFVRLGSELSERLSLDLLRKILAVFIFFVGVDMLAG